MSRKDGSTVCQIEQTFRVPLEFAFRWCTDYTTDDGKLSGDGNLRKILRKSARTIVYEDLYDSPEGWFWSRQTVKLHPPNRWTARSEGNHRTWDLVYTLRRLDDSSTKFRFWGRRRPSGLGRRNPSEKDLRQELHKMWSNFARAMEADYRRRKT